MSTWIKPHKKIDSKRLRAIQKSIINWKRNERNKLTASVMAFPRISMSLICTGARPDMTTYFS